MNIGWGRTGKRTESGRCSECGGSGFSDLGGTQVSAAGQRGYRCMTCGTIKPEDPPVQVPVRLPDGPTADEVLARFPNLLFTDKAREQLEHALQYANFRGLTEKLVRRLEWLATLKIAKQVRFGRDFAPYSFSFSVLGIDGQFVFNGGLIFYGDGDLGFGGPQFSVRGHGQTGADWEIHT